MTTRQTSIDCYHQIKANGLLSKRRFEVYEAIFKNAPCTSSEAMVGNLNSTNVLSQSRARFTELRELGVIKEIGVKECSVTGQTVIEWDLTDNLPTKPETVISGKKLRINIAIGSLRNLYTNKLTATDEDWVAMARLIDKI